MKYYEILLNKIKRINFKLPEVKIPGIKKILKKFVTYTLNTFTVLIISIGSLLAFASYINPVPFIADQFPNLHLGYYTLEIFFNDVKWFQSLGYIKWSISGGLITVGLLIHIRSITRLFTAIKNNPKIILDLPINTYKKIHIYNN